MSRNGGTVGSLQWRTTNTEMVPSTYLFSRHHWSFKITNSHIFHKSFKKCCLTVISYVYFSKSDGFCSFDFPRTKFKSLSTEELTRHVFSRRKRSETRSKKNHMISWNWTMTATRRMATRSQSPRKARQWAHLRCHFERWVKWNCRERWRWWRRIRVSLSSPHSRVR